MSATALPQEQTTPKKAWAMLAVVYIASFTAPLAQFKVPPLASWIIPTYGLDGVTFGYLMSALAIIGVILAFPAAFICRKLGLKGATLVSVGCCAVGTAIALFTNSIELLYFSRVLEGVGIGLIGVSAPTCVSVWFPEKTRGLALGIWATWVPIAITIAFNTFPTIAGAFGFQTVFMICLVIDVIAFVLFLVVFKLPEGSEGASAMYEGSLMDGFKLLKSSKIWILGVTFFIFNFVQLGVVNSFYNTFLEGIGYSQAAASTLTSIMTVVGLVAIPIVGAVFDRTPRSKRYIILIISYVLFFIALLFAWNTGNSQVITMWAFILIGGVAAGFAGGASRPMAPTLLPQTAMGATMAMAVLQFMQNLGSAIGSPLFGWGYQTLGWANASNFILLPLLVVAMILCVFVRTKKE